MNEPLPHPHLLLELDALRDKAMAADSLNALAFSMANDLYPLLGFHQALVFAQREHSLELLSVSGLARPSEDSPYLVWLRRASRWLASQVPDDNPVWLTQQAALPPQDIAEGWNEWWPAGVWCIPLHDREQDRLGLLVMLLEHEPPAVFRDNLKGLTQTWCYCWAALSRRKGFRRWRPKRLQMLLVLAILAALLLVPVRQTALAPTEIVSREAQIISSPIDGVIARILVRPNQTVEAGTPLFALDETTLRSRADVLSKEVAVADAELLAASQRAFDNPQSKGELTLLGGKSQQRRAELAAVQAQLKRTQVLSPRSGRGGGSQHTPRGARGGGVPPKKKPSCGAPAAGGGVWSPPPPRLAWQTGGDRRAHHAGSRSRATGDADPAGGGRRHCPGTGRGRHAVSHRIPADPTQRPDHRNQLPGTPERRRRGRLPPAGKH
jgi:hypothetical protein